MYKDLFTVFGYTVQTHSIISVLAIILAYGVALGMTRKTIYFEHLQNFIIYGIIAALVGARLWHVFVFQFPYYSQHPLQIFAIWSGGISIEGAIVGGIIALIIYTKVNKISFWEMADFLSPPMILGQGIGRIACFMAGDAFGRPTGSSFGVIFPPGTVAYSYYGTKPLWPAIAWESQGDTVIFALLFIIFVIAGKRIATGWVFMFYVFLYDLLRFILEFFRGDSPRYGSLTGGQWDAIALMIISLGFMAYFLFARGFYRKEAEIPIDNKE